MKKLVMVSMAVFALVFAGACASSSSDKTDNDSAKADKSEPNIAHVNWAAVKTAMDAGAILVDARGASSFEAGHIAGAVNIPVKDAAAWNKLPADKNTKIITYCGGPACSASYKAAKKCLEMGYTDVAEYKGGYPEWKKMQESK